MTEENLNPEEVSGAPNPEGQGNDDGAQRVELEKQAKEQGWTPREEFKGNPQSWVDADEFIKRGDPKYLRQRIRELDRRDREREARFNAQQDAHRQQFERLQRMGEAALTRQRDQLLAQIEAQKLAAVQSGDTQAYTQLRQAENEVWQRDQQVMQSVAPPQNRQSEVNPAVAEWKKRNSWFDNDPSLNLEAQAIHVGLGQQSPYMPLDENLRQVEAEIKRRYPHKFGIQVQQQQTFQNGNGMANGGQPRASGPSVEAGGRIAQGQSLAAKLPAQAMAQAQRDVARGLYPSPEAWAKVYFES